MPAPRSGRGACAADPGTAHDTTAWRSHGRRGGHCQDRGNGESVCETHEERRMPVARKREIIAEARGGMTIPRKQARTTSGPLVFRREKDEEAASRAGV